MVQSWDTFGLFQVLLDEFGNLLSNSRELSVAGSETSLAEKAAIVGFVQFSPIVQWNQKHSELIGDWLKGELSLERLSWYEEDAQAIAVFSCFAIGALLGKLQSGEIDNAGFLLGNAHLPGFISLHDETIGARYSR